MIGIVIVAHGGLAREYLAAMEHVVGKQGGTAAVSIDADDDCGSKQAEVDAAVAAVDDGAGRGGGDRHVRLDALEPRHPRLSTSDPTRRVLYGANLPLLVKLAKARHKPLNDAVASALTAGRKYINCFDGFGPNGAPIAP